MVMTMQNPQNTSYTPTMQAEEEVKIPMILQSQIDALSPEQTIYMRLYFRCVSAYRKVDPHSVKVIKHHAATEDSEAIDAVEQILDPDELHISQKAFDSDEFKALRRYQAAIRAEVAACCPPVPHMPGFYFVPPSKVIEIYEALRLKFKVLAMLVEEFMAAHPGEGLSKEQFRPEVRFLSLATPTVLESISTEIFAAEEERAKDQFKNDVKSAADRIAHLCEEYVDYLLDKLTDYEDGKKKKVYEAPVQRIQDFFQNLGAMNEVVHSESLAKIAERAKEVLGGLDVTAMKGAASRSNLKARLEMQLKPVIDDAIGSRTRSFLL